MLDSIFYDVLYREIEKTLWYFSVEKGNSNDFLMIFKILVSHNAPKHHFGHCTTMYYYKILHLNPKIGKWE